MDEVNVQIVFSKVDEVSGLTFRDALYFPLSQYGSMTSEQIEAIKEQRFNAFVDALRNPPGDSDNG